MKMQKMASAVLLLIITAIASIALAVPVQAKNVMPVYMFAIYDGLDEVREIPTGTWANILWAWATKTWDQVYDFLPSIDITWTIDGEPIDYEIQYFENPIGEKVAFFNYYWNPQHPGEYDAELIVTFTKDHDDGWYIYPKGTVFYGPRTILVTPGELYPQDPPEEPY